MKGLKKNKRKDQVALYDYSYRGFAIKRSEAHNGKWFAMSIKYNCLGKTLKDICKKIDILLQPPNSIKFIKSL